MLPPPPPTQLAAQCSNEVHDHDDLIQAGVAEPYDTPDSSPWMDAPETPAAPSGAPWNPQYVAIAILLVVVPVVFCRRRGGSDEDNYEVDESGRRRKIMHSDL